MANLGPPSRPLLQIINHLARTPAWRANIFLETVWPTRFRRTKVGNTKTNPPVATPPRAYYSPLAATATAAPDHQAALCATAAAAANRGRRDPQTSDASSQTALIGFQVGARVRARGSFVVLPGRLLSISGCCLLCDR